jgi:hypothetical protein
MWGNKLFSLLLFLAVGVGAQDINWPLMMSQTQIQSAAGPFIMTNQAGLLAYYISDFYTTNVGVSTLPDQFTNSYNLTNLSNAFSPVTVSLIGHKPIHFGTNASAQTIFLRNTVLTSVQPYEVTMLIIVSNNQATADPFAGAAGTPNTVQVSAVGATTMLANTPLAVGPMPTNNWVVLDFLYNGVNAVFWTNNVQAVTGNAGANGPNGITLAASGGQANSCNMTLQEMALWSASNAPPLRANIYNYWKTNYPSAGLP